MKEAGWKPRFELSAEVAALQLPIQLHWLSAEVRVAPASSKQQEARKELLSQHAFSTESVAKQPAIAATRAAYKAFGAQPSRYRPSAEALQRRLAKSQSLYEVSNVVDLINDVSLTTGCSIGGFDAAKIGGDLLTLQAGPENAGYKALGRGELNIHRLPALADTKGCFGTPTSDSERTAITEATQQVLLVVYNFGAEAEAQQAQAQLAKGLVQFAGAEKVQQGVVRL